ncbi:MAG: AraC family transcriptional regulator [Verrucomicrobiaceae bacterium]|nr:MAG: AraC family transcriptional regulator [Verrucomicrobiaceae bacterium]
MRERETKEQILRLLDRVLEKGYPREVLLAAERGLPRDGQGAGFMLHECPRLSICLSDTGSYRILREGVLVPVTLKKGDALVVNPGCAMGSHPEGKYLAFGLVFMPEMTRYLLAKRTPASAGGSHRFLLAHHGQEVIDEEIHQYFRTIARAAGRGADPRYSARLVELVLLRVREMFLSAASGPGHPGGMFTWKAAKEYIHENLHLPLGRDNVAEFLRIHPNHVSRLFNRYAETSFSTYLMQARMARARVLLREPSMRICEVAAACGLPDTNYFTRCFRKEFGRTPRESRHD